MKPEVKPMSNGEFAAHLHQTIAMLENMPLELVIKTLKEMETSLKE